MKPWETLGTATGPDGSELTLQRRGDEYALRVRGQLLMSSRMHGSEEVLAQAACKGLGGKPHPRVLIGGMGFGYTLRAALQRLGPGAMVTVVELVPAVVEWNRGVLAPLAGSPLEDSRVTVVEGDVQRVLGKVRGALDAVILDVDNGPSPMTQADNVGLYSFTGLGIAMAALKPGGTLAVWSASGDAGFERRMSEAGFKVDVLKPPARGTKGSRHTVFVGRRVV
jgi:spermidine synthase